MSEQNEQQFIELYEANWRGLLGYALRRCDSAEAAADVVAETFLVAWRRIDSVPQGDQCRPWLFGVARRVLSNGRRSSVRKNRLGEVLEQHLATGSNPSWADTSETSMLVGAAMSGLDDDDRELLRLTSWEGLTPTEIAVAMDIPAPTARTRLHRARKKLRAELAELGWVDDQFNTQKLQTTDAPAVNAVALEKDS